MKDIVRRTSYISILAAVAFMILGIILLNHPDDTIKIVCGILGGVFIVFGTIKIVHYFYAREKFEYYDFNLMLGALCILVGIVVITKGEVIVSILGIIFGAWIVLSSVNRINISLKIKKVGIKYWYLCLILALALLGAGLYVVFNPDTILVTLGATILIIYSIIDIVQSVIFIVNTKKILGE